MYKIAFIFVFSFVVAFGVVIPERSPAQTSTVETEAAQMDSLAVSQGQSKVIGKISSDFSSFLGPDSQSVVTGLRNGQLTSTTWSPGATTPTTTTVPLPTGKMGYGNVYISLALAKQQLSQYGITQPTQEQLQAALLGGPITMTNGTAVTSHQLQGILTMRGSGMGWGQIAQQLGSKLGPVMSSMKSSNHALLANTSSTSSGTVNSGGQTASSKSDGIVTGSGKSLHGNGKGVSGERTSGQGIVSGSGRSVGAPHSGIVTGGGRGHAYGVTGGGPGGGGDHGKGHNK